jgi:acetyltransferase-like isoleucine patch superfamily enzyme
VNYGRLLKFGTDEFRPSPWRTALVVSRGKRMIVGRGFRVVGAGRIDIRDGRLMLGTAFYGFADRRDGGLLRVRGRLKVTGFVLVAQGNRWDIGTDAVVSIGGGTYFSPSTKVVVQHGLTVGKGCAVAWDCLILDDDFHSLAMPNDGPRPQGVPIRIDDRVWIGSRVSILKGTIIGDGCVVASGSVVRGDFSEPDCLIAGVPAKVVRRGISWS